MTSRRFNHYNVVELAFYIAMQTICMSKETIPDDLLEQACEENELEGVCFDIIQDFSETLIDILDNNKNDEPISALEMLRQIMTPQDATTVTMIRLREMCDSLIEDNQNVISQIEEDAEDEIEELQEENVTLYNLFDNLQPIENSDKALALYDLASAAHKILGAAFVTEAPSPQ